MSRGIGAALAAVLLLAAPSHAAKKKSKVPKAKPKVAAVVIKVQGTPLTANGTVVRAGFEVPERASLQLARGGKAWLRMADEGGLLLIGPATMSFDAGGREAVLRLGSLLAVFPKLKGRFAVRSRSVVAAVRGTDFFVQDVAKGEAYICACSGTVEVTAPGLRGWSTKYSGEHHSAQRFNRRSGRMLQSDAGMEHHTDEDITSILSQL